VSSTVGDLARAGEIPSATNWFAEVEGRNWGLKAVERSVLACVALQGWEPIARLLRQGKEKSSGDRTNFPSRGNHTIQSSITKPGTRLKFARFRVSNMSP
jgi:hypothetical protein